MEAATLSVSRIPPRDISFLLPGILGFFMEINAIARCLINFRLLPANSKPERKNVKLKLLEESLESKAKRRAVLSIGVAAMLGGASVASCEQVRLEDVENPKLQEAIRAAVSGDFDYAEALFSELLAEDDSSASVWSNRGNVRVSLKKYEQALEDYTRAVILAPQAPVPLLNRAIANEALGRYEDAIADCKAAIKIDPEEYAAWYNLGNVQVRVEDYESAVNAYNKAAALAPGIAGYRFKQALVLFQVGEAQAARKLLQGLVRKYPNYGEAHAALAAVLWSEGKRSEAEDQFNQAGMQNSNYSDISWIKSSLEWPPAIADAMDKFMQINMK